MLRQSLARQNGAGLQARRDLSTSGIAKRARFKASLDLLRALEFSDEALAHYERLARQARTLPHVLVRDIAEAVLAALGNTR